MSIANAPSLNPITFPSFAGSPDADTASQSGLASDDSNVGGAMHEADIARTTALAGDFALPALSSFAFIDSEGGQVQVPRMAELYKLEEMPYKKAAGLSPAPISRVDQLLLIRLEQLFSARHSDTE